MHRKLNNSFVFRDRSLVKAEQVRTVLKRTLHDLGLEAVLYNTHSYRAGRTVDLYKLGVDLNSIKIFGRWHSNAIYAYLKN